MSPRWRLILAATLFIGWLAFLSYAALTKNRGPVVSHAQAAAAAHAVVAEVIVGEDGKPTERAKVAELLMPGGPEAGSEIFVVNLPSASGFTGRGQYLLYLTEPFPVMGADGVPTFGIIGQQRSPGSDLSGAGSPHIYAWSENVRKQFVKLRPTKP